MEKLEKEKQILEKSNKSQFRKTTLQMNKLNKKVERQEKDTKKLQEQIKEKDKAIQLLQVKLRQFLQRNM